MTVFLDFWIFYFWISGPILATERATGWCQNDRIFEAFLHFQKKICFRFLDFCIYFGFLSVSWERKELSEVRWCQNNLNF